MSKVTHCCTFTFTVETNSTDEPTPAQFTAGLHTAVKKLDKEPHRAETAFETFDFFEEGENGFDQH